MPTLLLQLVGPMQSWGTTSRFDQRDTTAEPSKSGVLGLVAAALGVDRDNWAELEPLTRLAMGVRRDRPGMLATDYQTAKDIMTAGNKGLQKTAVTRRAYLADAAFLVGLKGDDRVLLERLHLALHDPKWPLALGRKSYVPSEPVWLAGGLCDETLREALSRWPWIGSLRRHEVHPERLMISLESELGTGLMQMDQPLSSFAERRFGARFIRSEWIPFPGVTSDATA